jgi:hypothetical protein
MLFLLPGPGEGQETGAMPPVVGAGELFHSDPASGLALGGFDPVTYFLADGPRAGRPEFELLWAGVGWRFSSEANRAAFENNPDAFAPRFGGYDAEAVSRGRIVDAKPHLYIVQRSRLYLFRNDANRARFLSDEASATRAERHWTTLKQGLARP